MEQNFYSTLAATVREVTAQVLVETKDMTDADLASYLLQSARAHLAEIRKMKASNVLIEQAALRVAQLATEVARGRD